MRAACVLCTTRRRRPSAINGDSVEYWRATVAAPAANRAGNILGVPATFKLSVGYRF
jgi:hypothetical protein